VVSPKPCGSLSGGGEYRQFARRQYQQRLFGPLNTKPDAVLAQAASTRSTFEHEAIVLEWPLLPQQSAESHVGAGWRRPS